jgi:glutamate synthase (NADPH/NADH) small chain
LLALGFTGPETESFNTQLPVALDNRGNIARDSAYATNEQGVFVAGDAGRGQSLIVWAIAEGRAAAAEVDRYLEGTTLLPEPVAPTDRGFSL